jgi:hypothetical protein
MLTAATNPFLVPRIFLREFPSMTNWPLEILYILNADLGRLAVQVSCLILERDHYGQLRGPN